MRKLIIYNVLLITILAACSEREKITISDTVNPVLSSDLSSNNIVIVEETLEDLFCTFSWTKADFGFQSANSEYTLWMDQAGNDFADAIELGVTTGESLEFTNAEINQELIRLGGTFGVPFNVELKLTGDLNGKLSSESNTLALTITPLEVIIEYPKLYIAGSFTPGWNFYEDIAIFSVNSDNVYEGYIFMNTGTDWPQFQFSLEVGWVEASVVNDPDGSGTSGTLQVGVWGNNIYGTEGGGYYRVKANLNSLTYSLDKTEWGISGDFNGWGNTVMTYDEASDTWVYTGDFTAGGLKFIANGAWNIYYGGSSQAGILENPGENIAIAEDGNYTITLDLGEAIYKYSIVKN